MHNYVDFFRFNDKYDDVFINDGDYLYVQAEPFLWGYLLTSRPYITVSNDSGLSHACTLSDGTTLLPCETECISVEKSLKLEPAPIDIAKEIIAMEWVAESNYQDESLNEEERLNLSIGDITWYNNEICI